MRQDLTDRQLRELTQLADRAARGEAWTATDAQRVRSVVGEVQRLRDHQAASMHLSNLEVTY